MSLFPQRQPQPAPTACAGDVAQFVADLKPAFMRWPGGCIVEGLTMENRVNWKNTIGKPELRRVMQPLGLPLDQRLRLPRIPAVLRRHGREAMFVCNAGMSCDGRNGDYYDDDEVEALIQDALDAIRYATGDAKAATKWGAERAKGRHPAPFTLDYIPKWAAKNHSAMYAKYYNRF